jgi:hypothetical protein
MLNDYQEAQYTGGCMDDEPEPTVKAFYDMFNAAQKPLHGKTKVSQLFGTSTPCMTYRRMGYFASGVFTVSSHAQFARELSGSFG